MPRDLSAVLWPLSCALSLVVPCWAWRSLATHDANHRPQGTQYGW